MDEYEFGPPPEIAAWLEHQADIERAAIDLGLANYILVNGKIKRVGLMEWAEWSIDFTKRIVEHTDVTVNNEVVRISTVFVGIDMGFGGLFSAMKETYRPVLFESMIFGGKLDMYQWRYSSLGEAKRGHFELVDAVGESRDPNIKEGEAGFWMWFKEMFEE